MIINRGITNSEILKRYLVRTREKPEQEGGNSGAKQIPGVGLDIRANVNPDEYIQIPGLNTVISEFELPGYNNLNWNDTHFKLAENGLYMPTPQKFMAHFESVVSAYHGKIKLFYASGNEVPREKVEDVYNHLTKDYIDVYEAGRSGAWTWLDAFFKRNSSGGLDIMTGHRVKGGKLKGERESLEGCVNDNCMVTLSFNKQGLPTKKSKAQGYRQGKNIWFYTPIEERVAGFNAGSGGADLFCVRVPDVLGASLGVFGCAEGTQIIFGRVKEKDGYIHVPDKNIWVAKEKTLKGKNWIDTHKELSKQGESMLTIPEFVSFLNYLRNNKSKIADADKILDEIYEVGGNWRSEWLDAKFKEENGQLVMHYNHRFTGGNLTVQNSIPLSGCLMDSKTPGIDLDYWLKNATRQGLPPVNCKDGSLYYWRPANGSVARFYAVSVWASLGCGRDPDDHGASLGVRAIRR